MTILNKNEVTNEILRIGVKRHCTKLPIRNIVFPKWDDNGLFGRMLRQCVITKEFPEGHIYEETQFQLVMRVLDGKVLVSDRPDCYCWKREKVLKECMNGNVHPIGINSVNGLLNLMDVLQGIPDEKERRLMADMFISLNKDLMLVDLAAEERICIVVTQELLDAGITHCVDSYVDTDKNGNAPATSIYLDDILIVDGNGVYRVGREEASMTYRIGEIVA